MLLSECSAMDMDIMNHEMKMKDSNTGMTSIHDQFQTRHGLMERAKTTERVPVAQQQQRSSRD